MTPGYDRPARAFHWLTAVAALLMIGAGLVMVREGLPRGVQDTLFIFHKNTGVLVLLIVLLRAAWRTTHPAPPRPPLPPWQEWAARLNHLALYLLLLVMPLSGYIRVRAGGFPVEALDALGLPALVPRSEPLENAAQTVHHYAAWLLIAAVALHLGAALYHGALRRDGIVARMWPPA